MYSILRRARRRRNVSGFVVVPSFLATVAFGATPLGSTPLTRFGDAAVL